MNNQPADIFGFALERMSPTDVLAPRFTVREIDEHYAVIHDAEDGSDTTRMHIPSAKFLAHQWERQFRAEQMDAAMEADKKANGYDRRRIEAGEKLERDNVLFGGGRK
jgi:hypothetical protein